MGGIQTKDCCHGKEGGLAIEGAVCPFTPTGPWPRATSFQLDRLFVKNRLRAVASDRAGVGREKGMAVYLLFCAHGLPEHGKAFICSVRAILLCVDQEGHRTFGGFS